MNTIKTATLTILVLGAGLGAAIGGLGNGEKSLAPVPSQPELEPRVRLYQHRPPVELYDLTRDPHELANLAGDPAQQQRMAAMREYFANAAAQDD